MRFLPTVHPHRLSPAAVLAAALLLQCLLIFRAFGPLLTEPGQHLLVSGFDGMKNYFTFQAYLQQPASDGMRWFGMMNYPFGEYIFYTDNTPLLAALVRFWSRYVSDVTPYGLDIYHGLLISGQLLSTVLLVLILRRLVHYRVLVVLFAVILPWLSPQLGRLLMGHFNLSYSWVILLAIWGLLRIYERAQAGQPLGWLTAGLTTSFTLIAFIHLYYLPQLALLVGGFFACWLLPNGRWRRQPKLLLNGAALVLAPILVSVGSIRVLDTYYPLRLADPTGFNLPDWKLQLSALWKAYPYETTHFVLEPTAPVSDESQAYLGAFALFGLLLGLLVWLVRRSAVRAWWGTWGATPERRFLLLLGGASLVGLFASLGTLYIVADGQFVLHNYLSVFFYLRKITLSASHFRTVARFCWPFFWTTNFLVLMGLDYWLRTGRAQARWALAAALVLLALVDMRDTLKFYRRSLLPNPLTNQQQQPEVAPLLKSVRPEEYQAILPVPFFHVGSENMDLTLDDDNRQSLHSYQLALRTNLPLLASKMSRTPPEHARQLRTLFDPAGPAPELRSRLLANGKPILVLYDQRYYDGTDSLAARQTNPHARQLVEAGADFPTRQHLTLLAASGTLRLYRWNVADAATGLYSGGVRHAPAADVGRTNFATHGLRMRTSAGRRGLL